MEERSERLEDEDDEDGGGCEVVGDGLEEREGTWSTIQSKTAESFSAEALTTSSLAPSGNHSDTLRNSHAQYSQSSKVHTHVEPPAYYPNELYAPSLAPIGHGPGHDSDMVLESLRVRAIYEGSNRCVERYLSTTGTLLIFTLSFRLLGSLVKQRLREQESSSN